MIYSICTMVIPLQILAGTDAQAVRSHSLTLAEFPVRTQKVFRVYLLGVQIHLNWRDLIERTILQNQ